MEIIAAGHIAAEDFGCTDIVQRVDPRLYVGQLSLAFQRLMTPCDRVFHLVIQHVQLGLHGIGHGPLMRHGDGFQHIDGLVRQPDGFRTFTAIPVDTGEVTQIVAHLVEPSECAPERDGMATGFYYVFAHLVGEG